ncbi:MAG: PASTA domain-containing protein [Candidatus Acidiferrales bacterium]
MATLKERLQWIFRTALLLFVLASIAFLSALTAMRFAIQGREVAMPDVVGKRAVEAQQVLQGRGVGLRIEDNIYSPQPVDTVVRQSPPAGMRVKIGQFAHVVLSLGPQKATIPRLEERSLRAARIDLLRGGLQVGEISSAFLPGWQEDTVIRQDPTPGTTDVTSPHVNMLVSLGPRPPAYVMPELVGLPLGEAEGKLSRAKLKVAKLLFSPVPGATHGTVVGQIPTLGARVDAAIVIEIQVAE